MGMLRRLNAAIAPVAAAGSAAPLPGTEGGRAVGFPEAAAAARAALEAALLEAGYQLARARHKAERVLANLTTKQVLQFGRCRKKRRLARRRLRPACGHKRRRGIRRRVAWRDARGVRHGAVQAGEVCLVCRARFWPRIGAA